MYMYVMQDAGLGERGPALLEERCFEEGGRGCVRLRRERHNGVIPSSVLPKKKEKRRKKKSKIVPAGGVLLFDVCVTLCVCGYLGFFFLGRLVVYVVTHAGLGRGV